ncbi:unnamed protein product [Miscanthus lutarioriparius]|uniref:Uncharacterized protein n=1 Tax=Miscanthus lutarioriparius TaxID=422564 RepID=A0A811RHB7_9POAL|nr:unnamed protein product [Miscanthus lutarioriparius]
MAASSLSLAVLLVLVLVASDVPATAGGGEYSGPRMVIIRRPATTTRAGGAAGARSNKWRQHYRRLEDEVAPELGGMLLGAGEGGIGYGALDKDRPGCQSGNQCAAKGPGGSYTRGCTYESQCPHTPAGVAN